MKHFHGTYKKVCDKHDPAYYPRFKKWWGAGRGGARARERERARGACRSL
jgi:coproporphyrinogen III oxidase